MFLRRGLAEPVDLDAVLPEDREDRLFFLEEVEELVAYHRRKRTKQYQNTCRRYAGDVDGDDPVIVEGDGEYWIARIGSMPRDPVARSGALMNTFPLVHRRQWPQSRRTTQRVKIAQT